MTLIQHTSIDVRFEQQYMNSEDYLLPFIEKVFPIKEGMKVLEIGAAEGGVLKPFWEKGCWCLGVDLAASRIAKANELNADAVAAGKAEFITKNVYDQDFQDKYSGNFDIILLKDTIEHIPDQEQFIPYIKRFLKPGGTIFFGFPPWTMPFGGHQQVCKNKFLSKLPYYHILPRGLYRGILKAGGESDNMIEGLMEVKDTRISLHRFERIIKQSELKILNKTHFLFNPIYRFKFGLKPRKQSPIISAIPFFRDFVTTAGWYLVAEK